MIPIKGYSTFHPLKHCIVGKAYHPDVIRKLLGAGAEHVCKVMEQTEQDLSTLVSILESHGVNCYRPTAEVGNSDARPPISPRDYLIALGETLLVGKLVNGYSEILSKVDKDSCRWFLDTDVSSANMIRCGDHIHWDIAPGTKPEKENKIRGLLQEKGYRTSVTRLGWHVDGAYQILKPGVIVAAEHLYGQWLSDIYPGWKILRLDADNPQPPYLPAITLIKNRLPHWMGDYSESNYDVNILSIDEGHCVVPQQNTKLFNFLEKHDIEPIVCEQRCRYFWDNGIHCMTQDLYREGSMENYFN